jgi:superfamily II DNA or RNA helicase
MSDTYSLRNYQQDCVTAARRDFSNGHRSVAAQLPTASGKTIIALSLMQQLPGPALALAHTEELLEQAREKMSYFGLKPDLEKADARAPLAAQVVLGSVQSLRNSRFGRYPIDHFRFIWTDECQHAAATTYRTIYARFPNALHFGCTATLDRVDGEGYEGIYEKVCYETNIKELIAAGWLSRLVTRVLPVSVDLRQVRRTAGDFNLGDLSEAIGKALSEATAAVVANIADRQRVIVFVPSVNEARIFASLCNQRGVASDFVSGMCSDRREKIARFRSGETKLLTNCILMSEGFDLPAIDCVVLLRPTQSRALLCQQIGRGCRIWPGKEYCRILDFFWLTARHKLCAPASLDGVETEAAAEPESRDDRAIDPQRKTLEDYLREQGADRYAEHDPLADVPLNPFDVDSYLALPHQFGDPYSRQMPTLRQIETLIRLGIPAAKLINRGVVSGVFDVLKRRWNKGLATVPQARYLTALGHPDPWNATFAQAGQYVADRKEGRAR